MLSEEEKKKYEEIKYNNGYLYCDKEDVDFLIDIIEKQSKEIEDNKKYIDLHYVPYEQYISKLNELNKKWKDKIKAKIEELEKEKNIPEEMDFKAFYRIKDLKNIEIAVLQSLLEKE